MWQEILVGVIVALAVLSLLWRYLPLRWRQAVGRLNPAFAPKASAGACGGCSACGGDSCSSTTRKS
jgi:hypothetical protein